MMTVGEAGMADIDAAADKQPATLATLLNESHAQWKAQLAPACAEPRAAAAKLPDHRGDTANRLLKSLLLSLTRHMTTSRTLLESAEAIEEARPGSVDRQTLRVLRLEHLDFARIAGDLDREVRRLEGAADAAELYAALRAVICETHRHIEVAHTFILPRLGPAVRVRSVMCEPW